MDRQAVNQARWNEIYAQYSGKVMGYILSHVGRRAEAEDLCADVFEKVLRKYDGFDQSKASLSTWIYAITRNTVIDYYRRTRPTDELNEEMAGEGEIGDGLIENETLTELAGALRALPEDLRAIVVMMYYDKKPMTEIAGIMRLSYGAVKLRHQKALAMLKQYMAL